MTDDQSKTRRRFRASGFSAAEAKRLTESGVTISLSPAEAWVVLERRASEDLRRRVIKAKLGDARR